MMQYRLGMIAAAMMALVCSLVHADGESEAEEEPLRRRLLYNVKDINHEESSVFQDEFFEYFGRELQMSSFSMSMSTPSLSKNL